MHGFNKNKFTFDFLDSLDDFWEILADLLQIILDSPSPCQNSTSRQTTPANFLAAKLRDIFIFLMAN